MIRIFNTRQIREADLYTILHEPVASIDLMERAAAACINPILRILPASATLRLFCGPGNNGGDGLAIARMLHERGWKVIAYIFGTEKVSTPDRKRNFERLRTSEVSFVQVLSADDLPSDGTGEIWVDALFGTGLSRPLQGVFRAAVERINSCGARVVSIDVPSGLHADQPPAYGSPVVHAHHTLTFQFPKLSFLLPETGPFAGSWEVLDIGLHPDYITETPTGFFLVTSEDIHQRFIGRSRFSHKGTYGHAFLLAGSRGKSGAAVLAARACLRSGVGLLTVQVPGGSVDILQNGAPEAMVLPDLNSVCLATNPESTDRFSAIGIGPGIGTSPETGKLLGRILERKLPLVVDADALNLLSSDKELAGKLSEGAVLTPHPKEFERLTHPVGNDFERLALLRDFAMKHGVVVVLKGAYTCTMMPDGTGYFNSTGNAGLARGGSGDILTGMILSFLAQGYSPVDAALIGVFLHGAAADTVAATTSMQGMLPSDVIEALPLVFRKFERKE